MALRSFTPERVQVGEEEVWITPALAVKGLEEWYMTLPEADRPSDLNPPLPPDAVIAMLAGGIKAWSLTDDSGARVPVTVENIRRLDWSLGEPLGHWCNQLVAVAVADMVEQAGKALEPE